MRATTLSGFHQGRVPRNKGERGVVSYWALVGIVDGWERRR